MRYISRIKTVIGVVSFIFGITACHQGKDRMGSDTGSVPVWSPEASMKKMELEEGFTIKLVASEPLISTPVAIDFEDNGRIWALEMSDYRPIKGDSSIAYPLGKVVILEDTDNDGRMDDRKIFIDSLVMPRALCLVDGGLLVATPPNLWYIKIKQDKPGEKVLVDSAYTVSNNPEGQTNGLLRGMDNWIYSAGFGSDKRYRKINGHWIIEKTFLRGQWGLTQDNYGHLFYNNNSQNLLGDYFLPGVTPGNKYQRKTAGFNQKIVPDNRVYPAIPTPGVNRGYREGVLDSTGRLVHFTAACGPLIYRGGIFPDAYAGNAFVCEPAAYLIKRNILYKEGLKITGKQAYEDKEFLVSTDERFRPVNLYDGPDGAIYIVDMYRGIIQDDLSLTDYLKSYSLEHGLNIPINCGRIYKVFPKRADLQNVTIPDDSNQLVQLLSDKKGWVRDNAQQKIVDKQYQQLIPEIRNLLYATGDAIVKTHALWTLEGLGALQKEDIVRLLDHGDKRVQIQSLAALIAVLNNTNYRGYLSVITRLLVAKDPELAVYVTYAIDKIFLYAPKTAEKLWQTLLKVQSDNKYIVAAILSGIQGHEQQFEDKYKDASLFHKRLAAVLKRKEKLERAKNLTALKNKYPEGYAIFKGTCQTCHGTDGNGIEFVAPPLNGSNWVTGDKDKLISIVLYGLTGSIKVSGKLYKKPEVTGDMPAILHTGFSDTTIAQLLSFIRQAWNNNAEEVSVEDVQKIKKKYKDRRTSFTMEELLGKH